MLGVDLPGGPIGACGIVNDPKGLRGLEPPRIYRCRRRAASTPARVRPMGGERKTPAGVPAGARVRPESIAAAQSRGIVNSQSGQIMSGSLI